MGFDARANGLDVDTTWEAFAPWFTRALAISGSLGFFITVTYFVRIRNLPIDNIQSALGLASVMALLSIGVLAVIVGYWVLPVVVFRGQVYKGGYPVRAWFYGVHARNEPALVEDPRHDVRSPVGDGELSAAATRAHALRSLLWWFSVVSPPWTILSTLLFHDDGHFAVLLGLAVFCSVVAVACIVRYVVWEPLRESAIPPKASGLGRRLWIVLCAMGLHVLSWTAWLLLWNFKRPLASDLWLLMPLGALLAVVMSAAASAHRLHIKAKIQETAVVVAIVTVLLLILAGDMGVLGPMQDQLMATVSVRLPEVTLVIARPGCQAMATAGYAPPAPASGPLSYEAGCLLGPVTVRSRLAARWPVACVDDARDASGQLLTLRGEDVVDYLTPLPPAPARSGAKGSRVQAAALGSSAPERGGLQPVSPAGYCNAFRRAPAFADAAAGRSDAVFVARATGP